MAKRRKTHNTMAKRKKRQQENERSAKHYTVLLSVNTKKK
jgi:hypothetical protein